MLGYFLMPRILTHLKDPSQEKLLWRKERPQHGLWPQHQAVCPAGGRNLMKTLPCTVINIFSHIKNRQVQVVGSQMSP